MAHIQSSLIELDLRTELAIASLYQWLVEINVFIADISTVNVLQMAVSIISTQQGVAEEAWVVRTQWINVTADASRHS